jgi:hypothetical protein
MLAALGPAAVHNLLPMFLLIVLYVLLLVVLAATMRGRAMNLQRTYRRLAVDRQSVGAAPARRPIWFAVPAIAALFLAVGSIMAAQLRNQSLALNAVGMVILDGSSGRYPANLYLRVKAPTQGIYNFTYSGAALPSTILDPTAPAEQSSIGGPAAASPTFEEGARTGMALPIGAAQPSVTVALRTSVAIPGELQSDLHVDPSGDLVGTVVNGMKVTLLHPALISGRTWLVLPDLAPHSKIAVRLRPSGNIHQHTFTPILFKVYGEQLPPFGRASLPVPTTLTERIRDAVSALPETMLVSMLSETTLVAWTDQPLGSFTAGTKSIDIQSLMLLVKPLDLQFPDGPFRLRTGILGAHLVDGTPALPLYPCCGPAAQSVYVGEGGSAIFEFDLPAWKHFTFRRLYFDIYGGGAVSTYTEYTDMPPRVTSLYNWFLDRWVGFSFRHGETDLVPPNQYVSSNGTVLVKVAPPFQTVDITITDPRQDLQLAGTGVAE